MATPQLPVPPPKPAAYNTNPPNSSGAPNTEKLRDVDEDELPLSEFPHSESFKHRPVQRRATAPTRRQDPSPQFNQSSRPHHKPSHPHPPPKPQNGLEHRRSLHPQPQQPPRYKRKIGPYTLTKTLGAGSMGKVKLGIHEVDHSKVFINIQQIYLNGYEPLFLGCRQNYSPKGYGKLSLRIQYTCPCKCSISFP